MSRRPFALSRQQRPLSAIFIGSIDSNTSAGGNNSGNSVVGSVGSAILPPPDLPEPPSPSGSIGSGLPSPPATNSTGSGSVGDDSPNGGSIRKKKSVLLSTGSSSTSSAIPSGKRPESRSEMFNGGTSYDKAQQHTQQQYQQQQQSGISGGGGSGGGRGRSSYVDDDDDDPNENDEDHTARLSLERRRSTKTTLPPDDNISALARVKSLTQRNRMVLDKLTSISRLSSPAPSKSRSPFPTTAKPTSPTASSSASSSRHSSDSYSRPMHAHSTSELPLNTATASSSSNYDNPPSGSETEREPMNSNSNNNRSLHSYSSSDSLSATPTSTFSELKSQQPLPSSDYVRPRQISAPSSPQRNRNNNHNRNRDSMERSRNGSPGPSSRTRGKRVSMVEDRRWHYESGDDDAAEDVTTAALAAVASSRRSPSSGRKARNPLPKEFRSGERRSMDGRPEPPTTPHRNREREREFQRRSPSPNRSPRGPGHHHQASPHSSPRRQGGARYSTVRELTRKHQTRWLSEDLSASSHADREEDEPRSSSNLGFGRRQGSKNGSSESPLNGRLLGEGLRAAGLTTRRRDGSEDVFASPGASGSNTASGSGGGNGNMVPPAVVPNRTRTSGSNSVLSGEWDSPTQGLGSTSAQNQVASGGTSSAGRPSHRVSMIEPRTTTPGLTSRQERADRAYATLHGRPGTSMAALHGDSPGMLPPRTAPPSSATFRTERSSPYGGEDVYGRNEAPLPPRPASRAYVSPFAPPRPLSTAPPVPPLPALVSGANGTTSAMGGNSTVQDPFQEHRRLMLEALSMFESHLSRIPPMGQTTTTTIPEVFQCSQHLVHTMDKLNSMLKLATNKALELQIEAEVSDQVGGDGTVSMAEVWTKVGMEHRDNLRLSDEVVRSMTGFLLGVGKVLREATSSSAQQQQQHLRTVSLDDEVAVRRTPEVQTSVLSVDRRSSDGRKSRETRRSWDPRETAQLTALTSLVPTTTTNTTTPALTSTRLERGLTSRPGSSLNQLKSSSGHSSSEGRSVQGVEGTPQTVRNATSALVGSLRRPYTPRELRLAAATAALETPASDPQTRRERELVTYDSQETMQDYEPSPTPASRLTGGRVLAPLSIPPSLPTLHSETTLRRNGTITSTSSHTTPPAASSSNAGSSEHSLATRRKVSGSSNITVRAENSTTSGFQPIIKSAGTTTAVTPHTVSVSISPDTKVAALPAISSRTNSNSSNELSHSRSNTVTFSRSATTLAGIRQQQRQEEAEEQERQRRLRTTSTGAALGRGFPHTEEPSPINLRSPMSGSETERPRTFAVRGGRVSLDSANSGSSGGREVGNGRGGRVGLTAATLLSSRKERRRTITEIFSKT